MSERTLTVITGSPEWVSCIHSDGQMQVTRMANDSKILSLCLCVASMQPKTDILLVQGDWNAQIGEDEKQELEGDMRP